LAQKTSFYEQRTIKWNAGTNSVEMIDQTVLPNELKFIQCRSVAEIIDAIKTMKIRGAPAIGVAGAMGVVLSVFSSKATSKSQLLKDIEPDSISLKSARPTAVNLAWGVERAVEFLQKSLPCEFDQKLAREKIVEFAQKLADDDVKANKKLSDFGAKLFRPGESVLTHCN
jgi:methylthioribose-1-phosphate isomerase